jgi:serine/threonine-protein kinase HipA
MRLLSANTMRNIWQPQIQKSLKINDKSLGAIYKRFDAILPTWIDWIQQSFLSEQLKEDYISVLNSKHQRLNN